MYNPESFQSLPLEQRRVHLSTVHQSVLDLLRQRNQVSNTPFDESLAKYEAHDYMEHLYGAPEPSEFAERWKTFLKASPVDLALIAREDLVSALHPSSTTLLFGKQRAPSDFRPFRIDAGQNIPQGYDYFLPNPIRYSGTTLPTRETEASLHSKLQQFTWTFAWLHVHARQSERILSQIGAGALPVAAIFADVMVQRETASVLVRVDAGDSSEWLYKIRTFAISNQNQQSVNFEMVFQAVPLPFRMVTTQLIYLAAPPSSPRVGSPTE